MVREGGRSAMAFPTQAQPLKDEMTQEEGAPPWPLSCSSIDNNTPRYKTVVCAFGPETYHDRVVVHCMQHQIQKAVGRAGNMLNVTKWIRWDSQMGD